MARHPTNGLISVALSLLLVLALADHPAAQQQERMTVGVKVPGGKVSVSYTSTTLRGRAINKDLKAGDVWRMSAGPAAELITEVPLIAGTLVIAPGRHRLSARYLGNQHFRLLLFRGPPVFAKGTPYRELPLRFHEEERSRDQLSFRLQFDKEEGTKGEVRFRTYWGKHSLNFNLQVLPMSKTRWTLAGKPATLTFFELPRNEKIVDDVKAGIRVHFGMLVQDDKSIRYDLFGVNTRRGYYVECRNFTVPDTRLHIEAQEATAARIEKLIETGAEKGDAARVAEFRKRLASLREAIATSKEVLDEAENLPRKVRIACQIQPNPEPAQGLTVEAGPVGGKNGDKEGGDATNGKVRILLKFGQRIAACILDPKEFRD
jgi:hypothetical protein